MEDEELTKKTTILFPLAMHQRLCRLAAARGVSLGELVRTACIRQYGIATSEERLEAVRALAALGLPVAEPDEMKQQAVPSAESLVPCFWWTRVSYEEIVDLEELEGY
jgi:hypothetical protein